METKIKTIINNLSQDTDNLYIDGAFLYLLNNQISVKELKEILSAKRISLPSEFDNLSLAEQKSYRRWWKTKIYYENGSFIEDSRVIFNNSYFYDLADHARKTIHFTDVLTKYVYDLVDVNLLFLGMQYIKIKNTKLRNYSKLMEYADKNGINDLYELTIKLCGKRITNDLIPLRNLLTEQLKKDTFIGIDFSDPFSKMCLLVESLLYDLPRKEANTMRIKFLILKKTHLRNIDYFETDKTSKALLKDYESYFSSYSINELLKFSKTYPDTFTGNKPNGYLAFYYSFVEGK